MGYALGIAPFLGLIQAVVPGLEDLLRTIPQGLDGILGPATAVLSALLALALHLRAALGTVALGRWLRRGLWALPAGASLLFAFQLWFVIRHPVESGRRMVSVIVAPPRTSACLCSPELSDLECLELSSDPAAIARCWGGVAVARNEVLWSLAYLLFLGGCGCALGLLYLKGKEAGQRPLAAPAPVSGFSRPPQRDVFLSHNSADKPVVRELAKALRERGISTWFDEEDLPPGRPWQEELERVIATAQAAAVLIGSSGLGPWEDVEMRACLMEMVARQRPVLPVLLPGAPEKPDLPLFLRRYTWVDLRVGIDPPGLERLVWGITGDKPAGRVEEPPSAG